MMVLKAREAASILSQYIRIAYLMALYDTPLTDKAGNG